MEEMNVYEEQVNETEELIPVEAEIEEEAGMSNAVAFALGGLATAGAIWVVKKVTGWAKKRKAKKAAEADDYEEIPEEEDESASENGEA